MPSKDVGENVCIVLSCDKKKESGRRICSSHHKQRSSGLSLALKAGFTWNTAGRPHKVIGNLKQPSKKILKIKSSVQQALGCSVEDLVRMKDTVASTVMKNVINLYHSLPQNSPFKKSLLQSATTGLTVRLAAETFGVNPSTISNSKKLKTNMFYSIKSTIQSSRQQIAPARIQQVQQWMLFICLPKSGDKRTIVVFIPIPGTRRNEQEVRSRHPQRMTDVAFYAHYVAEWYLLGREDDLISFSTFKRIKPHEIRRERWFTADDKADGCPKCLKYEETSTPLLMEAETLQGDINELEKFPSLNKRQQQEKKRMEERIKQIFDDLAPLEAHMEIAAIQRKAFRAMKESLEESTMLVVQDFTKHYAKKTSETENAATIINDFVIVVYWKEQDGLKWRFFHILSSVEKQTNLFVETAWRQMMRQFAGFFGKFTQVKIWSDGGPQHFKVIKTMGFFANFHDEFKKKVEYHFFASYHGKSICDAHAGVMKRSITRSKEEYRKVVDQEGVEKIGKTLKHTDIMILEEAVSLLPDIEYNGAIKKWHKFQYHDNGKVKCFLHSESENFTSSTIKFKV
jgi:hypothetical protein